VNGLSPSREARRDLAIGDALDARDDPQLLRRRCDELVDLNRRLYAEQRAELGAALGCVPDTIDGCIGVLAVAAWILEAIARGEE
jgi:hypothetical protein